MSAFRERPEYRTGANAELHVAGYLASRGLTVARVAHGGSFAPNLLTWAGEITVPDLQVCWSDGRVSWLDVKWKTTCGEFFAGGFPTTGIDLHSHAAYLRVERLTGHAVSLIFTHLKQNEVRLAHVNDGWFRGFGGGRDKVYWPWDSLRLIASYAEVFDGPARPARVDFDAPLFAPRSPQLALPGVEL